jgi:hypothetical protein
VLIGYRPEGILEMITMIMIMSKKISTSRGFLSRMSGCIDGRGRSSERRSQRNRRDGWHFGESSQGRSRKSRVLPPPLPEGMLQLKKDLEGALAREVICPPSNLMLFSLSLNLHLLLQPCVRILTLKV